MNWIKTIARGASISAIAMMAPAAVYAQQTASELRGSVVDTDGNAVSGATVLVTHVPTGSVDRLTTSASGAFFQTGLRVGGPYTIAVEAAGFQAFSAEGINLAPGSQAPFRVFLTPADRVLDQVVVLGSAINTLDLNNGVGTNYSSRDVSNQPSLARDIPSILARDPLAVSDGTNNLSVAGVNPRFNGVTIDGATQKDNLGLGTGSFATRRSPIDIDIVESVQLVAADYSVTASNFTGGGINVVTKGGTNDFDGAAYYYFRDAEWQGKSTFGGTGSLARSPFEEKEYGITLGGPIIKDRLFFLVNYSKFEDARSIDFTATDAANGTNPQFFSALNQLVLTTYGIDMGGRPQQAAIPEESERLFARFDWNINDDHRLQVNLQQTEEVVTSVSATNFQSAWFDSPNELNSYTAQLFSDWTPNLSTRLRASFTENTRLQNCRGGNVGELSFAQFDNADLAGSALAGLLSSTVSVTFTGGCDRFRHTNTYADERIQLFSSADYTFDDVVFTVGSDYDSIEAANAFSQFSRGQFVFNNLANVTNRIANVNYRNVTSNNTADYITQFAYSRLGAFAQARWQVAPELEVNAGLRYERISTDDRAVNDPTFLTDTGITNTATTDGLDLIMPRVSFRWDAADRTTLTGGIGLFAGGDPGVWTLNTVAPRVGISQINNVANVDPRTVPAASLAAVAAATPTSIDALDPNFEIPSDWKASLRLDHSFDLNYGNVNLGDDYVFSAQVIRTESQDGFRWQEFNQTNNPTTRPLGVAPDGRPIYADLQALGRSNRTVLTNETGDVSYVATVSLQNAFENGFDFFASYAFQDVEAVSEGTSSRGVSNFLGQVAADRNNPGARSSLFEVEHSFKLSLGYEKAFFGDLVSRVDLFGAFISGAPYTYTFDIANNNALFGRTGLGENPFDNSPLYVPSLGFDPRVVYAAGFNQAAFNAFVEDNGLERGIIQDVNEQKSNWSQRWDFRFQQDLPGIPGVSRLVGDNNLKLVFDIENLGNLLNDKWGTDFNPPGNGQLAIVTADLVRASDVANLGIAGAPALTGDAPRTACVTEASCVYRFNSFRAQDDSFRNNANSVWRARIGLRYEF